MSRFHLVSLGCPKNFVDSEVMLGILENGGWQFCEEPEEADLLLINTCGFIQSAVEEAIDEILALASIKAEYPEKYLVVTGCLVERYQGDLIADLPEVDLFLGTEAVPQILDLISSLLDGTLASRLVLPSRFLMDASMPRRIATPSFRAWIKITEGCNNRCSYCMIPNIRGPLRSRPIADLLQEAQRLEASGVKEISLIAQDLTAYGRDLGLKGGLHNLLESLLAGTRLPWIRLLYLYPSGVSEELLDLVGNNPRILPYLDMPFQHVSDQILAKMNRPYSQKMLYQLVETVRGKIPNIALRTTLMVGFPGETDADIQIMEKFLQDCRLDHVGLFAYANESGVPSESYPDQCPDEVKSERLDHISAVQAGISSEIIRKYLKRTEPVLVEGLSRETDLLLEGRTRYQAPDIDGCVYINEGTASPGDIVLVEITETMVYDLVGRIV